MSRLILFVLVTVITTNSGCSTSPRSPTADLPTWEFTPGMVFPADRSLMRPEDGVVLADGRLIVGDQVHGLRLLHSDGTSRPFGDLAGAGYVHDPPLVVGGPNGVSLEPDGVHILVCDVFRGGIYRVNADTEATERIYQHQYGVNTARRDTNGGLWFTQSTRNEPAHGEEELFRAVDLPTPDGTLYYLPPSQPGARRDAVRLVDGLTFANGIALDEANGYIYVAETMASQVLRFRVDITNGRVSGRAVAFRIHHPDNLELDAQGRLWVACPLGNGIVVADTQTGAVEPVFRIVTPESKRQLAMIEARLDDREPWLELLAPPLWEPAPGLITGMILSPDDGTVYATGLGSAIIRLPR